MSFEPTQQHMMEAAFPASLLQEEGDQAKIILELSLAIWNHQKDNCEWNEVFNKKHVMLPVPYSFTENGGTWMPMIGLVLHKQVTSLEDWKKTMLCIVAKTNNKNNDDDVNVNCPFIIQKPGYTITTNALSLVMVQSQPPEIMDFLMANLGGDPNAMPFLYEVSSPYTEEIYDYNKKPYLQGHSLLDISFAPGIFFCYARILLENGARFLQDIDAAPLVRALQNHPQYRMEILSLFAEFRGQNITHNDIFAVSPASGLNALHFITKYPSQASVEACLQILICTLGFTPHDKTADASRQTAVQIAQTAYQTQPTPSRHQVLVLLQSYIQKEQSRLQSVFLSRFLDQRGLPYEVQKKLLDDDEAKMQQMHMARKVFQRIMQKRSLPSS